MVSNVAQQIIRRYWFFDLLINKKMWWFREIMAAIPCDTILRIIGLTALAEQVASLTMTRKRKKTFQAITICKKTCTFDNGEAVSRTCRTAACHTTTSYTSTRWAYRCDTANQTRKLKKSHNNTQAIKYNVQHITTSKGLSGFGICKNIANKYHQQYRPTYWHQEQASHAMNKTKILTYLISTLRNNTHKFWLKQSVCHKPISPTEFVYEK